MAEKKHQAGKIGIMVHVIADIYNLDEGHVRATLARNFPELKDKSKCANCGANMEINKYTAGILNTLLILKMAEEVRHRLRKGIPFTEANKIHVPSLQTTDGVKHSVTIASYLNLVIQPKEWSATGYWLITNWGWKALRGGAVPKQAIFFRGDLLERSRETTTLKEMFTTHTDKIKSAIERRKKVGQDYRADVSGYDPIEWYEVAGTKQGNLI